MTIQLEPIRLGDSQTFKVVTYDTDGETLITPVGVTFEAWNDDTNATAQSEVSGTAGAGYALYEWTPNAAGNFEAILRVELSTGIFRSEHYRLTVEATPPTPVTDEDVPSGFTAYTLAEYIHDDLGSVATVFGWSVGKGSYNLIITETLLSLGMTALSEVSSAAGAMRVVAIAKLKAWQKAVKNAATYFNFSADGASFSRSQIQAMVKEGLAIAQAEAMQYDGNYRVGVDVLTHKHDPYRYLPEEDRSV